MGINDLSELIDVSNIELVDEEMTLFDQADYSEEAAELAKNDEMV
jgi:segregation and condensation protein B